MSSAVVRSPSQLERNMVASKRHGRAGTVARRCRSVSPPVKQKLPRYINLDQMLLKTSHKEAMPLTSQQERHALTELNTRRSSSNPLIVHTSEDLFPQPISPIQPIIKQFSNSYMVKQPKPLRVHASSAKARSQVLSEHGRMLSISSVLDKISLAQFQDELMLASDINGNIRADDSALIKSSGKVRKVKVCHPRSASLPVTQFTELRVEPGNLDVKPAKKRKPSNNDDCFRQSQFYRLPLECKLKIFSYLNHNEKGNCMLVSNDWYRLIRCPALWRSIDFREFTMCHAHCHDDDYGGTGDFVRCNQQCYGSYIGRIEKFISFLIDIKATVKKLAFEFDLIADNWLATVERFVMYVNIRELQYAYINWRDTPAKPYWLDEPQHGLNDILYKCRRRQRKFLNFFEMFIQEAPNVKTLILPFEWSARSIKYLLQLKKLRHLTIEKYFVLQRLSQDSLNAIGGIPNLETLVLEVWTPSAANMSVYTFESKTLKYFDISRCRGFFLGSINLPVLETFVTERRPWNGPLTFHGQIEFPCICNVLLAGTKCLTRINNIRLDKSDLRSTDLTDLMKKICPCTAHKTSITM